MELRASKFDLFWATYWCPNGGTKIGFCPSLSCSPWKKLWNMKRSSDTELLCREHVKTYFYSLQLPVVPHKAAAEVSE